MSEQGLSLEGSLSTALSDSLFKLLGIDSFIKEKSCSRSEPPYSINQLQENGWSSGSFYVTVYLICSIIFCGTVDVKHQESNDNGKIILQ